MDNVIYLDYNGSAPLDPRVTEAIIEAHQHFGNAAASHIHGRRQALLVDDARGHVANLVGFRPNDVIFTAGATEGNNLAIQGFAVTPSSAPPRVLISAVEHASITQTARWLSNTGQIQLEVIPVSAGGDINVDALTALLQEPADLVSVMAANSETGILNPIDLIAEHVHNAGALFHCDATQLVGRLPIPSGPDMISMSSHKICGPTGVGALVANQKVRNRLTPLIHGGGHEDGLRSGSPNVAGITGFGKAAELAHLEGESDMIRVRPLRDRLAELLVSELSGVTQVGDINRRLPNTLSMHFASTDAEAIMANCPDIAMSAGSACSSGAIEPSAVLTAMGFDRDVAFEVLRLSLGRFTSDNEIERAASSIVTAVRYVRSLTGGEKPHATI
mgnify:CR=1 FL=1|tara:strand:+ start:11354 stop:12520 length:1167 start_codon:yes stop_codon:yes gene_type:complete